jgi:hypothetical protein
MYIKIVWYQHKRNRSLSYFIGKIFPYLYILKKDDEEIESNPFAFSPKICCLSLTFAVVGCRKDSDTETEGLA